MGVEQFLLSSQFAAGYDVSRTKKMQLYNNLGLRPLPVFSLHQFQETPRCDFTRWLNESTWCHGYLQTCTQVHRIKAVNHVLGCIVEEPLNDAQH